MGAVQALDLNHVPSRRHEPTEMAYFESVPLCARHCTTCAGGRSTKRRVTRVDRYFLLAVFTQENKMRYQTPTGSTWLLTSAARATTGIGAPQRASTRKAHVWYAAARVPLKSVSETPVKVATRSRMNLYRIEGEGPDAKRHFLCWQPTCVVNRDPNHVPENFGTLVFSE